MEKIKSLREATGLSLAQISRALTEAGGDEAKAAEILKSYGAASAEKKSTRDVHEGVVDAYVHGNKKVGALIELQCETDFVARNEEFKTLAHDIAMHVVAMRPADEAELLGQAFIKDPNTTIQALITAAVAKLGENVKLGKFVVFEL